MSEDKGGLGARMKLQYEDRTRYALPRRTYTILRVDGKAFHTLLRGSPRPYDPEFSRVMDLTARAMCRDIQGARLAFVQSDEISVLLTDFAEVASEAWFDGNVQKIASVGAAMATAYFGAISSSRYQQLAVFDGRCFTIPDVIEVENYFIWRQQDAMRNSVSMAAQALYSPRELHGKGSAAMQDMMMARGVNWNDYPNGFKRGRCVAYRAGAQPGLPDRAAGCVEEPPVFTADRAYLRGIIPAMPERGTPEEET